jgi:hypothetical protein
MNKRHFVAALLGAAGLPAVAQGNAAKPVDQRFAQCPWGLYDMDVQAS